MLKYFEDGFNSNETQSWINNESARRNNEENGDAVELNSYMTEYIKIDRRRLDQLIETEGFDGCQTIFDEIMSKTNTFIYWPSNLTIGAKSRKDPHLRIVGQLDRILGAKRRIQCMLEGKASQVVVKIDINQMDHPSLIGHGGCNIQWIINETNTHIHFPTTRNISNQVAICGSLAQAERARSFVRLKSPLVLIYVMKFSQPLLQEDCYIKRIESLYNVRINFKRTYLQVSQMVVKGIEQNADMIREATQLIINFFNSGNITEHQLVKLQMEVTYHFHNIVKGYSNEHLIWIMQSTQTNIIFPFYIQGGRRDQNKITIYGRIDSVYKARQLLLGFLPVTLKFELPFNDEERNLQSELSQLNVKYGVHAVVQQTERQRQVVIKGLEKYMNNIYETRREILRLETTDVRTEMPDTYYFNNHDKYPNADQCNELAALLAGHPPPNVGQTPWNQEASANYLQPSSLAIGGTCCSNCDRANRQLMFRAQPSWNQPEQQQGPRSSQLSGPNCSILNMKRNFEMMNYGWRFPPPPPPPTPIRFVYINTPVAQPQLSGLGLGQFMPQPQMMPLFVEPPKLNPTIPTMMMANFNSDNDLNITRSLQSFNCSTVANPHPFSANH